MPTTYQMADKAVHQQVAAVMEKYHGDLTKAGATFCVTFAEASRNEAGEIEANPVTIGGYSRPAKIKIFPLVDRAEKNPDFRITIDQKAWTDASEAERNAIIDGQLERLELKKDSDGAVKPDDLGRPKLSLKKWDHCFQWFDSVARRHGKASVEVKEAKAFFDESGQAWFGPMLWDSPDGKPAPTATEALDTLTGAAAGNGEAAPEPKGKGGKGKGRGKRTKDREFVNAKTGEPVEKAKKLPDAGSVGEAAAEQSHGDAWAAAQKPQQPAAMAN